MRVQKNQFFFGLGLTRAGNGFPEVSLLLPLCNELEITVNEDEEIRMINEKLDFYVIERYFGRALFCHHLTDIQFFSES